MALNKVSFCTRTLSSVLLARTRPHRNFGRELRHSYNRCFSFSNEEGASNGTNADEGAREYFDVEAKRLRLRTNAALEASKYTKAREKLAHE